MQKYTLVLLALLAIYIPSSAQVVNRYPNIQSPDQHSAIIAWRRATAAIGTVTWGTSPTALTSTLTDTTARQIHAITISGLRPNTKYYYQALSDTMSAAVSYFYTAKPDSVRDLSFLVYGDCGFDNSQQDDISALMATKTVDFGLVVGDVDQLVGAAYDVDYYQHYTAMLKSQCHFTAIGNHDVVTNNTNYTDAFNLPHNNPANSETYYSFTWGNAKFITIDGNSPYTAGTAQYVWLQNELKCNNSEWTFVYFHQPPWSNGWDVSYYIPFTPFYMYQGNVDMRTSIVPLFEQYHVDVVLNGHTHNYERGIYNGVRYFIAGGGGASTPDTHTNSNSPDIQFELSSNNFMQWTIRHDGIHYEAYDLTGAIIDSASFGKTFTPYSAPLTTTDATCLQPNGKAVVSVTGPHPPYTLSWSTGSSSDSIVGIPSGNYTLIITDSNSCQQATAFTIQNHSGSTAPSISAANNDSALCKGTDLTLSASLNGLTDAHWNTGDTTTSLTIQTGGTYYLTAVDSFGCAANSDTLHIQTDSVTHLQLQANINYLALGLTASQSGLGTYLWDFGNGHVTSTIADSVNYTYPDSGTYTVKVITTQPCGADTATTVVRVADSVSTNTGILYMTGDEVKVTITPNPLHTTAQVQIEEAVRGENFDVKLYDLQGRLVADLGKTLNDQLTIKRGNLATGQYILRLSNHTTTTALRLEIQ
jgi:hypothetical protein